MDNQLQSDLQNIHQLLEEAKNFSLDFLGTIDDTPTGKPALAIDYIGLPQKGIGASAAQTLFKQNFLKAILATAGSRYWGYVIGGSTPAAIAGDWLTTVFDQNPQNADGFGDMSAVVELDTIKMLLELFGLPATFNGGFVAGATMSNFTCLAVARQWFGKMHNIDIAKEGNPPGISIYAAVPHSSAIKSLSMLGLGSNNLTLVPTLPDRECMDVAAFKTMLEAKHGAPFILITSGGTVNTVDFDDMEAIALLKQAYNFWWHIDAAFGAFAACSPGHKHLLNGWQHADSITIDCHKWLNVPYDSAVFFTKKEHAVLQVETFQNDNAPYLGDPMENFNYLNFVPDNSRRLRALPAWFTLQAYGKSGYQSIVENNIALAQQLGEAIEVSDTFMLAAPVRLNTVCFTVKNIEGRSAFVKKIVSILNDNGKVFMTPTIYNGKSCIRAALVNWRTGKKDVEIAMDELTAAYATATNY